MPSLFYRSINVSVMGVLLINQKIVVQIVPNVLGLREKSVEQITILLYTRKVNHTYCSINVI
jgi:hypothetical protein